MSETFVDPVKIGRLQKGSLEERIGMVKAAIPDGEMVVSTGMDEVVTIDESGGVYRREYEITEDEVRVGQSHLQESTITVDKREAGIVLKERLNRSDDLLHYGQTGKVANMTVSYSELSESGADRWAVDEMLDELRENWETPELSVSPDTELVSRGVDADLSGKNEFNRFEANRNLSKIRQDIDSLPESKPLSRLESICEDAKRCFRASSKTQKANAVLHDEIVDKFQSILSESKVSL